MHSRDVRSRRSLSGLVQDRRAVDLAVIDKDVGMAPEQVTGGDLGPAADVWGLGAVLYEATAGRAAYEPPQPDGAEAEDRRTSDSGRRAERHHPQLDGPPIPVRRLRRTAPATLAALIERCLATEPARRPPVERVLRALEPLAGCRHTSGASRALDARPPPRGRCRGPKR
jgi:serine/threonine protein kinase